MSHRTRSGKAAAASVIPPSKSKKKAISTRMKKSAPTKRHLDSSSTTLTQPRQKRLSSLTAAALVHYCTSVLTPSRKAKRPSQTSTKEDKASLRKRKLSNVSCKSDPKNTQTVSHTRTRREASSRASAMIMQQNEIERSRFNYTLPPAPTTTVIRPQRTKTEPPAVPPPPPAQPPPPPPPREPFQFNVPSTANLSKASEQTPASVNLKYPSLTEAILAEHDRLHETLPAYQSTKHEHLVKWTQELALCGRLSPHEITLDSTDDDTRSQSPKPQANAKEISTSSTADSVASHESIPNPTTTPSFLFPSAGYPLDFRSLYPLMPCWQYLGWPYPSTASLLHSASSKKTTPLNFLAKPLVATHRPHSHSAVPKSKNDALTFHVHTHHHHHIHNSNSLPLLKPSASAKTASLAFSSEKSAPSLPHCKEPPAETKTVLPLSVNNVPRREQPAVPLATETHVLNATAGGKTNANQENGAVRKTTRRKSSPVKRGVNSGTKSQSIFATMANEKISSTADPPIASPRKPAEDQSMATPPIVSDDVNFDAQPAPIEQLVTRRSLKRRSVSAAVVNSNVIVAVTRQSTRGSRTISASCIPSRSKSSRSRKRTHSATSVASASSNKRKRAKISHHWALCGRASQQLVSLHADKPPVFRDCYASIRHITEKDVIKSGDCIILQPDAGRRNGATPYLAKVKWFWQEPKSDEILMSLIWYYHPEHTELPARVKQRFLPNELLASRYADCVNVACIEDKCYVLNLNEYNRYCLREASPTLFDHSESVGQLKVLLNKNTSTVHHRPLPGKTVGTQNIFFCRYVYDYRVKRISKNPSLTNPATANT